MHWVKCSDRRPEKEGINVLSTDGENIHIAIYNPSQFSEDFLDHDICDYACRVKKSTHWMHLPTLPEKHKE